MKITIDLMKKLANTGVKALYTRNNGETREGKFVTGEFIDCLGKTFNKELAFIYDEPVGNGTFVSKNLDNKDFEIDTLSKDELVDLANYKKNTVLYHAPTTDEWVLGRIVTGEVTTCLGDVYDKKLAFVSFEPYGEDGNIDINANKIWEKDIILISKATIQTSCDCKTCTCGKHKTIGDRINELQAMIDELKAQQTKIDEPVETFVAHETVTIKETRATEDEDGISEQILEEGFECDYYQEGRQITCIITDVDEDEFVGVAICREDDEFDLELGKEIAYRKALAIKNEAELLEFTQM